ncbi:hypothetical protein EAG18_01000 [Pseudoalteromonas sp. J010]|uniref:hypothetical protein n=1 Tax=Pseudoalteromonas sp. J010 TaxID=998465 RepID=UPI000F653D38|nr:hypothetical protein [Pseudoalteromonas sp. J010]RRS10636.1 hypothetical protein EAG18_01000 [Pseudoalteromonas sp. J010]
MTNDNILIFSIALNGYQIRYRRHLASQRRYAERMGYDYTVITKPWVTNLGAECCWLKLYLLRSALAAGYDYVLFVDADAYIQDSCPNLSSVIKPDKFLFMANGYSGRLNSGVMLMKACPEALLWLDSIINAITEPVVDIESVGWGENGHVIHFAKNCDGLELLNEKWNNTKSPQCSDYIRHYNYGPMKNSVVDRLFHKLIFKLSKLLLHCNLNNKSEMPLKLKTVKERIPILFHRVISEYKHFS